MVKSIIFFVIAMTMGTTLINSYAIEGDSKMRESINLAANCGLSKINKIKINTEKFALSYSICANKEITNSDDINKITNTLQSVQEIPVCDTMPQYKLAFYSDTKQIVILRFFIDGDWYFLREKIGTCHSGTHLCG